MDEERDPIHKLEESYKRDFSKAIEGMQHSTLPKCMQKSRYFPFPFNDTAFDVISQDPNFMEIASTIGLGLAPPAWVETPPLYRALACNVDPQELTNIKMRRLQVAKKGGAELAEAKAEEEKLLYKMEYRLKAKEIPAIMCTHTLIKTYISAIVWMVLQKKQHGSRYELNIPVWREIAAEDANAFWEEVSPDQKSVFEGVRTALFYSVHERKRMEKLIKEDTVLKFRDYTVYTLSRILTQLGKMLLEEALLPIEEEEWNMVESLFLGPPTFVDPEPFDMDLYHRQTGEYWHNLWLVTKTHLSRSEETSEEEVLLEDSETSKSYGMFLAEQMTGARYPHVGDIAFVLANAFSLQFGGTTESRLSDMLKENNLD